MYLNINLITLNFMLLCLKYELVYKLRYKLYLIPTY